MGREEEVVVVAQDGEHEVPQRVDERVVRERDADLPQQVPPVNAGDAAVEDGGVTRSRGSSNPGTKVI